MDGKRFVVTITQVVKYEYTREYEAASEDDALDKANADTINGIDGWQEQGGNVLDEEYAVREMELEEPDIG